MRLPLLAAAAVLASAPLVAQQAPPMPANPFLGLMTAARAHAEAHGAPVPVLSPVDATLLGDNPPVNVAQLHKAGFRIVPWTTDTPEKMRALIDLRVDGIITDFPDMLQNVLKEEAAAHPADAAYFASFDVAAHRGGRGLRPENTLPSLKTDSTTSPPRSRPIPVSPPTTSP
ncbi:MAG TPA: glycerophosphodiester phosphodiesterase family protein [Edaphobacter sp.]|nr:glycerophosphodiester phosphodiesterase family protein [Edaphobacter sp.]